MAVQKLKGLFEACCKSERAEIEFGLLGSYSVLGFVAGFRFGLILCLHAIVFSFDITGNLTFPNLADPGKQLFTMHVVPLHLVTCS